MSWPMIADRNKWVHMLIISVERHTAQSTLTIKSSPKQSVKWSVIQFVPECLSPIKEMEVTCEVSWSLRRTDDSSLADNPSFETAPLLPDRICVKATISDVKANARTAFPLEDTMELSFTALQLRLCVFYEEKMSCFWVFSGSSIIFVYRTYPEKRNERGAQPSSIIAITAHYNRYIAV